MKGLIIFILLLASFTSYAGTYRWVDENGQTHFGDRPPQNVVTNEVRLKAAPPSVDAEALARKQRLNEFLQNSEKEREARSKVVAEQEAKAAKQKAYCEGLQARLKYLARVSGIYELNKEGERVFVNDEENERIRKEFKARVQRECGV